MAVDAKSGTEKRGTKGIPHTIALTMDAFREVLYQTKDDRHKITINSLMLNRNKAMCRTTMLKQGLSDIFVKLAVASDKITCSPIIANGEYI